MFVHTLDDRAVSRLVRAISPHLKALGAEVSFVCATQAANGRIGLPAGIRLHDLRLGRRPTALGIPNLARLLRRRTFDVLFAHLNGPGRSAIIARGLARAAVRVVPVEHTHYSTFYRKRRWLRDRLTAILYPHADRVAGGSQGVLDDLIEHFPGIAGRTVILPSVGPEPSAVTSARESPPDHPWFRSRVKAKVVCSVGNVVPRKGQAVLIEALPLLRSQVGDVRLVLVGRLDDEEYAREIVRRAEELGVSEYLYVAGYQADALAFMAHADVFAFASTTEGAPMVLVEAMACGVPVVSTDCPVGPREILEDGQSGLLVPMNDAPAMATAVAEVLRDGDLRERLIAAGRRRAQDFSPEAVAGAYLRLARELHPEAPAPAAQEAGD
jgi:glycosyltransferase involved in cell wall biosynthesis